MTGWLDDRAHAPRSAGLRSQSGAPGHGGAGVFAEHGFGATLDDIARQAGLGTGTAYRHFPNKHAIAAEVLREATSRSSSTQKRR